MPISVDEFPVYQRLSGVYQAFIRRLSGLTSFLEKVIISQTCTTVTTKKRETWFTTTLLFYVFRVCCECGLTLQFFIHKTHMILTSQSQCSIYMWHIYMWVTSPIFIIVYPSKIKEKYGVTSNTQTFPKCPSISVQIPWNPHSFYTYSHLVGGFKHVLFSISYMGCHPSHWRTP